MDLTLSKEDEISIVTFGDDRFDALIAPYFKQKMQSYIEDGHTQIILDISHLKFMDSSSLGAMVSLLKYMGSNGKLVVVGAKGIVLDLFLLTRMNKIFTLAGDVSTAKDFFKVAA